MVAETIPVMETFSGGGPALGELVLDVLLHDKEEQYSQKRTNDQNQILLEL